MGSDAHYGYFDVVKGAFKFLVLLDFILVCEMRRNLLKRDSEVESI